MIRWRRSFGLMTPVDQIQQESLRWEAWSRQATVRDASNPGRHDAKPMMEDKECIPVIAPEFPTQTNQILNTLRAGP